MEMEQQITISILGMLISVVLGAGTIVSSFFILLSKIKKGIKNEISFQFEEIYKKIDELKKQYEGTKDADHTQEIKLLEKSNDINEKFYLQKNSCMEKIDEKISEVWNEVDKTKEDVSEIKSEISLISEKHTTLCSKIDNLEMQIERLAKSINEFIQGKNAKQ